MLDIRTDFSKKSRLFLKEAGHLRVVADDVNLNRNQQDAHFSLFTVQVM